MSSRRAVKRACDGCKIRKIKCSDSVPCEGCQSAGIACTWLKHPAARGPRKLRRDTLEEIAQTQQHWETLAVPVPAEPVTHDRLDRESVFAPAKVAALALQLCVYRIRCYALWPIIKVERLLASLQRAEPDIEVFALAYAVAAATIAQIRVKLSAQTGGVTAEMMEAQAQFARTRRNKDQAPDLTTVRIPFFLHIYHENLEPGGLKSITYLREAIAVAHMIGLHRESYYVNVEPAEREIRRRTLWLLFVTERGVSILHRLPVTIKTKISFPSLDDTDEREVLMAYQKLISMFWHFDQAGVFELLDSQDFDMSRVTVDRPDQTEAIAAIRKRLDQTTVEPQSMNDIQALDMVVTRCWMRVILWRLAASHGFFSRGAGEGTSNVNEPVLIAEEMLAAVFRASESAVESQGPSLETKVFEIASTVADAISLGATGAGTAHQSDSSSPSNVLTALQKLLARNTSLYEKLRSKIGALDLPSVSSPGTSNRAPGGLNLLDMEIEQQLQAHGFEFTDPLQMGQSPDADSVPSGSGWSPGLDSNSQLGFSSSNTYTHNIAGMEFDFNTLNVDIPPAFNTSGDGHWDGSSQQR